MNNSSHPRLRTTLLRFLTHNFWLKLLSILFAIVLFIVVRTDKEIVFARSVKIKIMTLPHMTVVGGKERTLEASIKVQSSVFALPPSEAELAGKLDVLSALPGHMTFRVSRENFPHLGKKYILFFENPYLDIQLDNLVEKELPIKPVLLGQPEGGYVITGVHLVPDKVTVKGASHEVGPLVALRTLPLQVEGLKSSLVLSTMVDKQGKENLVIPKDLVQVHIEVKAQ